MIDFLKNTFGDAVTEDVVNDFKSELGKKFVAKADYNTKRDELKDARARLEELSASEEETAALKEAMETLQRKYEEHVSVLNGKLEQMSFENEISQLIRKHGGKNEKALRALLDFSADNSMESAAAQLDVLKKSDPYLFDTPAPGGTKGNFPRSSAAPQGNLTYSQMMKLEGN